MINWQDSYFIEYPFDPSDTDIISIDLQPLLTARGIASDSDIATVTFTLTPSATIVDSGRAGWIAWATVSGLAVETDYYLTATIATSNGLLLQRSIRLLCRQR